MSATTTKDVGVPTLRFLGFDDAWKSSTLGEATSYTKGFAFKSKDYRKSGIRIIRVSDLAARLIKKDNNNVYVEESRGEEFSNWKIREKEIVITTVGSRPDLIESAVGRGIFIDRDGEGLLNQNMLKIKSENGNEPWFIFSQINTPRYTNYIAQIKRGNANQANITVKDLMAYRIVISSIPEQQKIADFLTAVDKRIQQLMQKKALLEEYKKGVMQQIFSQTIRFKGDDGNDFPDWEEKTLGNSCSFIKDGTHGTHPNDLNGPYFLLSAKNIKDGRIMVDNTDRRISETEYSSIYKNYKLKYGDVLLSVVGTIGRLAVYRNQKNVAFQRSVAFLRFDKDSPDFMYQQLCHTKFQIQLLRRQVTSAQPGIYLGDIAKIPVISPSLDEQTKIANFLSAIDRKIETVATQITETQSFKRGLLQQMFV